jgi:hypothetical protein
MIQRAKEIMSAPWGRPLLLAGATGLLPRASAGDRFRGRETLSLRCSQGIPERGLFVHGTRDQAVIGILYAGERSWHRKFDSEISD